MMLALFLKPSPEKNFKNTSLSNYLLNKVYAIRHKEAHFIV